MDQDSKSAFPGRESMGLPSQRRTKKAVLAAYVALTLSATGCAGYHRKPLVDRELLRQLDSIRLDALGGLGDRNPQQVPTVDTSAGLSGDQAVAVALFLNPELRAFRKERGIAEGELVSARLIPNPEIQASTLGNLKAFTGGLASGAFSLLVVPPRPGERGARIARAQARIEQVRNEVSAEEWKLATDVRKAYLSAWAVDQRLHLANASLQLQERIRNYYQQKRQLGDASRLDVNLVRIEYSQALRDREKISTEHDQVRQLLNRLLGLPPLYELRLHSTSDPLAYRPFSLDPSILESLMLQRRSELAAAKAEYEQAERNLQLAYMQRMPWFRVGPSFERESGGSEGTVNRVGLGFGFDIPLFNLNQGEIAIRTAERDKLWETFRARLHAARAELNESYRNLRAQERLIKLFQDSIKPALDENAELTEAGFQMGDFNLVQLVTTQDKVLRSRQEFIDAEMEYWKAVADVELTVGLPLAEAESVNNTKP
jgi:cobalt-zinc-cadmium efflux system outer membrane protein